MCRIQQQYNQLKQSIRTSNDTFYFLRKIILPAHMSIGDVYEVERSSTSGARYHLVDTLDTHRYIHIEFDAKLSYLKMIY